MALDLNKLSPDQISKGMSCKSLDEFKAFIKDEGLDVSDEEAQSFFEEMYNMELSDEELEAVASGGWWDECHIFKECKDYQMKVTHRRLKK